MSMDYENTMAGGTDISGTPPPVRSPQKVSGDTARKVNQASRGPKSQNPVQQASGAVGDAMGQAGQALESQAQQRSFQDTGTTPFSGWNPIDWGKQVTNDASMVWGLGRRAYSAWQTLVDPQKFHTAIHHVYQGNSATDRFMQMFGDALSLGATPEDPMQSMQNRVSAVQQLGQAGEQLGEGKDPGQVADQAIKGREPQAEATTETAPAAAPDAAAAMLLPEQKLGQLAVQAGLPIGQALLSTNPDEQHSALMWAAMSSLMMGVFHLPPGVRDSLSKTFGGQWPVIEKQIQEVMDKQREGRRSAASGTTDHIKDWIDEQLKRGGIPAGFGEKPIARARAKGEPIPVTAVKDPKTGAIQLLESQDRKRLVNRLNRLGIEDIDSLVHKGMTEGISDPKLIKDMVAGWKDMFEYDLRRYHPDEMPLQNPVRHMDSIGDQKSGAQFVTSTRHYLDQIHRGLFASHHDPMLAMLRSLAGNNRATVMTHQKWIASAASLLGEAGLTEANQAKMMRAAEGDAKAYDALSSEAKMVVDAWGLKRAAAREERSGGIVPNWVPRTNKADADMQRGRGRPSRASLLAKESTRHREESIQAGPGGQLVMGQKHQFAEDANKALAQGREEMVANILSDSPLVKDVRYREEALSIRKLAASDGAAAREQAQNLAARMLPDKDTHFLRNVNRAFANEVRAIHTNHALEELGQSHAKDGRKAAIATKGRTTRDVEELRRSGYQSIDDARFQGYVFHPDLAGNLNRYLQHASKLAPSMRDATGLKEKAKAAAGNAWQTMLDAEGKMVAAIMFSPVVHGMNMAGRAGMAAAYHPLEMLHYLKNGKAIPLGTGHEWDDQSWALRSRAWSGGLMTPHSKYADNIDSSMRDAFGDTGDVLPDKSFTDTATNRLKGLAQPIVKGHERLNNYFWGAVNDFGVMMFHLEETAALKQGMQPEAAMEYAGRRANTWMGMVAPEDTNPILHDASRLVAFAPNWWRTWAELMVPWYRRAGFTEDPAYARHAAYQGAKTAAIAFGFQKLTGTAANFALSGHGQNENDPGQQDRLEISRPEILHALQDVHVLPSDPNDPNYIDPSTGRNPRTGSRFVVENALARQQLATETALGLQSGQKDYKPQDTYDGLAKFLASRFSPMLSGAAGMANVDVYRSVADHNLRAVDPSQSAASISPASLLYGAIMMTPAGANFSEQVARSMQQGQPNAAQSALGTKVPTGLQGLVGDVKDQALRTAFSWITGVNPPYEAAQKTRGVKQSDEDYQRVVKLKTEYQSEMSTLSQEALSGQMTPAQWRQQYHDLSQKHAAAMGALYKDSPQYVNGAEGMLSDWENLYQKATQPDGSLDYDRLTQLQAEFRSDPKHSQDGLRNMDTLLKTNDSRYPMLKLYHQTLDQYTKWQQQWATKNNVDLSKLHQEIKGYGATFGDSKAGRQYLAQHHELAAYENAKKREWERTPQGMVYSLFYGQNASVMRYIRSRGLTPQQFVEQSASAA